MWTKSHHVKDSSQGPKLYPGFYYLVKLNEFKGTVGVINEVLNPYTQANPVIPSPTLQNTYINLLVQEKTTWTWFTCF